MSKDCTTPESLGGNRELRLPRTDMLRIARRADFPMASALAMMLMVVVSLVYLACARWLKLERV